INESVLAGMPGNVVVVRRNNFVGVVADKEIRALRAATRLASMGMVWTPGVTLPPQQELYDYMRQQPSRDSYTVLTANTLDPLFDRAASVLRATYLYPYQMHGSVGTSCAVADVRGSGPNGTARIWSATQGVYPQRDSVAMVLDIPRPNVEVIFVEGSG